MSIYPEALDTDLEIPRIDENVTEISGDVINSLRDAVFAIENALGLSIQGNTASLVERINGVIDDDGNIKTSALSDRGLITLPITNTQIGENAGIQESKLDLEFSTSFLNGRSDSNSTDIDAVTISLNTFAAQTLRHFIGTGDRHDGYQVDLLDFIRDFDDVESALHAINNALIQHESTATNAHAASSISVNNEFQTISANNVQEALVELDNVNIGAIDAHQDAMHDNAIVINTRGHQGEQGNLSETILASTIYQTDTSQATNILQVMRPNAARVTSKNINPRLLALGVAQNLRVIAGGINRDPLDINLSSIIPVEDLDIIITKINESARSEHYPISAYDTGGKLTIAHSLPGEQFTIQISDGVSFSAAESLGFGDITSTIFTWSNNNHAAYVGGKKAVDIKSLIKVYHNHTGTSDTISLGLGNLSNFGFPLGNQNEGRILCHITNHSTTPENNGTYYILSYPTTTTFVLSDIIQSGEFDIEIAVDSVNFINSTNGEIFDIFLEDISDGYGVITKSKRVSYGPISGVNIRAVSNIFPNQGIGWQVSDATFVKFLENGSAGESITIPSGFQGQLKVYAPDNINSALIEVTGNPSSSAQTIVMTAFAETDDTLYISSVHYAGNFGLAALKFVTDKRKIGGSVENKTENKLSQLPFEEGFKDLRNNGIVRGFEFISSDGNSFSIRGGRAYVDGRKLDIPTKEITVTDFSPANKLLLLDRYGNYIIKDEFDSGYSLSELTQGDSYGDNLGFATIMEFHTDGASIDGYYVDRRFFIGNIDKRLRDTQTSLSQRIEEVVSVVSGSFWGNVVAQADISGDGYLASIEGGNNFGFTDLDERGFSAGDNLVTTRRFQFSDPDTIQTTIFRAVGLTHINVFVEAEYTGSTAGAFGPFGVSGTVSIDIGIAVETGIDDVNVTESYVTAKTIPSSIFPSDSVVERYLVSIPVSELSLASNVMFDVVPRVRVVGSTLIDGGPGGVDPNPVIRFDHVRVVTSSYSIAGNILGEDGAGTALATTVGDVL